MISAKSVVLCKTLIAILSQVQRSSIFVAVGGASSVPGCDLGTGEKVK
jgi:hypothetical protein